jgi:hypothetical protein
MSPSPIRIDTPPSHGIIDSLWCGCVVRGAGTGSPVATLRFLHDLERNLSMKNVGRVAILIIPLAIGLLIGYVWGENAKVRTQAVAAENAMTPPGCCKTADASNRPQGGCCCGKEASAATQDSSSTEAKTPASCCKTVSKTEKSQGGCCCGKNAVASAQGSSSAEAKAPAFCCKPASIIEEPQGGCGCGKKATTPAQDAPTDQGPAEAK